MIRRQSFEAATKQDAESLAADWRKRHAGCRMIEDRATATGWLLTFEYDDLPRPN
jgi:hypothetical protein